MRLRPLALAAGLSAALGAASCASSRPAPQGAPSSRGAPSSSARTDEGGPALETVRHVDRITSPPQLAGARCPAGQATCACRAEGQDEERPSPPEGMKRFEIRMSADGGEAALDVPGVGRLVTAGARQACFYIDLPAGSTRPVSFRGRSTQPRQGFTPRLEIAEYGPAGPYWYDTLAVECTGGEGRCDRAGADAWAARARTRRRGRVDPCGSAVVSKLAWENTGAEGERDGGYFHDFQVTFDWEVKKFATQFAPGSTECVPK